MSTSDQFGAWVSGLEQNAVHEASKKNGAINGVKNGLGSGPGNGLGNGLAKGLGNGVGPSGKITWPVLPPSARTTIGPTRPGLQEWEISLAKEPGFAPSYVNEMFDADENAAYEKWLVTASVDDLAADYDASLPSMQEYEPIIAIRGKSQRHAAEKMASSAQHVYEASVNEARLFPRDPIEDLTLRDVLESKQPQDILTRFSDKHIACDRLMTNDNLMHLALGQYTAKEPENDVASRLSTVERRLAQRKQDASQGLVESQEIHRRRLERVDSKTIAFVSELR